MMRNSEVMSDDFHIVGLHNNKHFAHRYI